MSAHPYFPLSLSLPHYVPSSLSLSQILAPMFGAFGVVFLAALYAGRGKSLALQLSIAWFTLSGCIHLILEGYFSYYHDTVAGRTDFLAEVWKEYAKGDSRYVSSENFVVCMETVTAFAWGPLCLVTAYGIVVSAPWRYVAQVIVSLGQLYGCVLFFALEYRDHFIHSELGHPLYFWFYFVFMNGIWIVVPLLMLANAWATLSRAQASIDSADSRKKKK